MSPNDNNERFAIAARLHTLLRRKTGRVTDIDWLAVNDDYATEIVRFALSHVLAPDMEDLAEWAYRLEQTIHTTAAKRKLPPTTAPTIHAVATPAISSTTAIKKHVTPSGAWAKSVLANVNTHPTLSPTVDKEDRYVGGLR